MQQHVAWLFSGYAGTTLRWHPTTNEAQNPSTTPAPTLQQQQCPQTMPTAHKRACTAHKQAHTTHEQAPSAHEENSAPTPTDDHGSPPIDSKAHSRTTMTNVHTAHHEHYHTPQQCLAPPKNEPTHMNKDHCLCKTAHTPPSIYPPPSEFDDTHQQRTPPTTNITTPPNIVSAPKKRTNTHEQGPPPVQNSLHTPHPPRTTTPIDNAHHPLTTHTAH
ncbi:uncharacterized protein LACBIDRAFT_299669 [Laccaria bicolor S238N-H82]|uniref:Predicted protein n=1 Tax=Laccaria bicolor (strain S238N-H82 / ATCC MYA-4686) TaxID=486041 RepID=B0DF46_LACBS|nr:uncharacterized protein LACBIDRAFT_299669 [Laccaria bicolor S238N-H82]EDR06788.1 predicted protein [Laccaria bicolor S238N-H82]|eukprot:XP_001882635.1 predicted protein [Laccaria bicolor S238N-H82]